MSPVPSAENVEAVEISELVDFLSETAPFDALDREDVAYAARNLEITYAPVGTDVLDVDADTGHLYLVRTGAVELFDEDGALVARLGERDFFGYPSLLTDSPARRRVRTIEDSLLYLIPEPVFDALRGRSTAVDGFFARAHADRIRDALRQKREGLPLTRPVRALLHRQPVTASPSISIREAAARMRDARVSSLLLVDTDAPGDAPDRPASRQLTGILTDRDLRIRVVADGADLDAPVRSVMTADPVTINADAQAFQALLTMSRHNVHHLPVVEPGGGASGTDVVAGMVTTTDLMRLQADNPVYLVGEVWKQDDLAGLEEVTARIPQVVVHLAESFARADDTSRLVTAVTDAVTERLLQLAEDAFGPPPVPYAWLALGSQARREQTAHSDQDNALLLSDDYDPDAHGDYFRDLAAFVCDGLDACGYQYCPGEVMAVTDRWRQPVQAWKDTFRRWIDEPEPKALMHASIFFDLRCVHGACELADDLRRFILERTAQNSIFLACLTVNAMDFKPPLGFFRQFVLEEHGGQEDTLDLKHNGLVPIVDLARINALARGVGAVNTLARLDDLAGGRGMAASDAADLRDAYEFIAGVRLRHQARQIQRGEEPDNYVAPAALSDFDRRHLKDAFKVVSRMQSGLQQRYQTELISR